MKNLVEKDKMSLRIALKATMLSKSVYYYRPNKADRWKRPLDEQLVELLINLPKYERTYGYRRVTKYLWIYNHKKVYRHMKELKLTQPRRLKKQHKKRLDISCPV